MDNMNAYLISFMNPGGAKKYSFDYFTWEILEIVGQWLWMKSDIQRLEVIVGRVLCGCVDLN